MTSISSLGNPFASPLQRLQNGLSTQIAAGRIASTDETVLSAAVEDIDEAMQSQAQSDRTSGTRPTPSGMQAKLEELIASQVENGSLTSSQADELEDLFASAMPAGGSADPGADGAPSGPPPSKDSDDTSSSSATYIQSLLEEFMASLQAMLDQSSANYGANGRKSSISASLVIDYQS